MTASLRHLFVMAGLGPAIHVFSLTRQERRGWLAFPGHDERTTVLS